MTEKYDKQKIEEVARIVLEVIEKHAEKKRGNWFVSWVKENFGTCLTIIALLVVYLVAYCKYDAHLLYPMKELGHKSQEFDHKSREFKHKGKEFHYKEQQWKSKQKAIENWLALGSDFLDAGNYDAAREVFKEAGELDKNNVEAQMGLFKARVFETVKDKSYDPEVIRKRIELIQKKHGADSGTGGDPHAHVLLGEVFLGMNDLERAKEEYEKALKVRDMASAHAGLGAVYDLKEKTGKAIPHLEKAVELSEWNRRFLNNLAYALYKTGQYQKALDKYARVLKLDSSYLLPFYIIAKIYLHTGDHAEALIWHKRIVERLENEEITKLPKNSQVWYFKSKEEHVMLYTLDEKRCYAWYCMALNTHLSDMEDAHAHIEKVRNLKLGIRAHSRIRELVLHDVAELEKIQQDAYAEKLNGFKILIGE